MKRIIALILASWMILAVLPFAVLAEDLGTAPALENETVEETAALPPVSENMTSATAISSGESKTASIAQAASMPTIPLSRTMTDVMSFIPLPNMTRTVVF